MPDVAVPLPCRRSELVIRPLGDRGPYVVKDPGTKVYYQLEAEEHFLLTQLDGRRDVEAIHAAFAERFGEPLSAEDLQEFLTIAKERRLLQGEGSGAREADQSSDAVTVDSRAPLACVCSTGGRTSSIPTAELLGIKDDSRERK
jgi:putative peptide zinc metalloprotease protein